MFLAHLIVIGLSRSCGDLTGREIDVLAAHYRNIGHGVWQNGYAFAVGIHMIRAQVGKKETSFGCDAMGWWLPDQGNGVMDCGDMNWWGLTYEW